MKELADSLASLATRLWKAIKTDPELRSELRSLGKLLLTLTDEEPKREDKPVESERTAATTVAVVEEVADRLKEIDLSAIQIGSMAEPEREATPRVLPAAPMPDVNTLALIERRCRLKAEASRWAARRMVLIEDGADFETEILPKDLELISRAKETQDCFLWMCNPESAPVVRHPSEFEDLGSGYEICVSAARLLRIVLNDDEFGDQFLEHAMYLAAEAQSMLRVLAINMGIERETDQLQLFVFLKALAREEQVFIRRHMKSNDLADPQDWNDLLERIEAKEEEIEAEQARSKRCRNLLQKIRYHVKRINDYPDGDHDHDWKTILNSVDQLIEEGLKPSDVRLRDLLLPLVDDVPDSMEVRDNADLVFREIDRFLASRPVKSSSPATYSPSPEVEKVAQLLNGKVLVVVGGDARPHAKQAIEEAFGLKELAWVRTSEQNPKLECDGQVARDDVAAVLLVIRWSRHSYDELSGICDKYNKPLVRLPGGYNPNQIADQVLKQCSERLGAET